MVVLSLFDGMSCGQIALKELEIIPDIYYASEVDKFAIAQTQLNFPNTIQLGDVAKLNVFELERVDLLIGGSPCQNFSFAGKRNGMNTIENEEIYTLDRYLELKEDGFEFEGESYLFWEYMRILADIRTYNPDVLFLLENVEMGKKWERVLSKAVGLFGVHINSDLVSAQNRERIYWTNIRVKQEGLFDELHSDIPLPKDKGLLLKDVIDQEVDEKYYIKNLKFRVEDLNIVEGGDDQVIKIDIRGRRKRNQKKASCFTAGANSGGNHSDMDLICVAMRGRNDKDTGKIKQQLEPRYDGKTNTITKVQKDNLIIQRPRGKNKGGIHEEKSPAVTGHAWQQNNLVLSRYHEKNLKKLNEKANSFLATSHKGAQANGMTLIQNRWRIRRLTPTEVARLQTVPDWYVWECSETQQYKMCGNGWTIEVIKHILSFMRTNKTNKTIKKKIMKKAPIIVSNNFPGTHARAGEETGFIEKIRKGEKIHTIRGNFEWWKERIQKIYRGEMYLSIRCWEGKPYHTKQIEMMKMHNVGYQEIEIVNENGELKVWVDGELGLVRPEQIAANDGLSLEDFRSWFFPEKSNVKSFKGIIIHFTKFRYPTWF